MKKFIAKVILYLTITLFIIISTILYFYSQKANSFLFVSNSASYNLKAGFLHKNLETFKKSKIVVLGSSMGLNNINSKMVQDSLRLPTINLSSWGLKLSNFREFDIWDSKIIIYNIQFPDFGKAEIEIKNGFSFEINKAQELVNIASDIQTFLKQQDEANWHLSDTTNTKYNSCNYDECGSVLFSDLNFNIDSARWNLDNFKANGIDDAKLAEFVLASKEIIESHPKHRKIIITFSPARRVFYNKVRSLYVYRLGLLLKVHCPSVIFINEYDTYFDDRLFVDNCHFNRSGATKFTGNIIDILKNIKLY